ncbi:leucine-rich repeat domain-containing protein, partial [Virgibacillus sp. W0430]|uniref:leucine-rich repeat domain-containing protein n=1 Tax=Virgibacillus sp. W0430 TaxID=3391580 RepID=UPI003F45E4B2
IEFLHIGQNDVSDSTALKNLTNLKHLYAFHNHISDITALQNLEQLTQIYLSHNHINDFSPLQDLNNATGRFDNQSIQLDEVEVLLTSRTLEIDNPLIDIDGTVFDKVNVIDGSYRNPTIKWDGLTGSETERTFTFDDGEQYGVSGTVTQPIKWVVDEKPVIHASDISILQGSQFDALDQVTATDKESGILTDAINVIKDEVDISVPGSYEVAYEVTDNGGQKVEKTITVTVIPIELSIPLGTKTEVFPGQIGTVENTGTTITFPSDLPLFTLVTITDQGETAIVTDAEGIERAGDVLEFHFEYLEGQSFYDSFELTMSYGNGFSTEVDIYYYNEVLKLWEVQNGIMDVSENTITINPNHFSTYGVFALVEDGPNIEEPVDEDYPRMEDPSTEIPEDVDKPDSEESSTETPENEERPGSEDPQGEGNSNGDDDKSTTTVTVEDDSGGKDGKGLPMTATNTFFIIAIGFTIIILGGISFVFIRRRELKQ